MDLMLAEAGGDLEEKRLENSIFLDGVEADNELDVVAFRNGTGVSARVLFRACCDGVVWETDDLSL